MHCIQVSTYASYLYDAVALYVAALDEVLTAKGNIDDGRAIIDTIRGRSYKS